MRHQAFPSARPFWPVLVIFLASILTTLLFWKILPPQLHENESSDYIRFYEPVARNILAGRGFIISDGLPSLRYPPGYPLLLAGILGVSDLSTIPEETILAAFNLLCMGLAAVFLYLLARSIWGVWPALITALLWTTYPFALWLTKQPSSEIPFLVVFYGGFCFFYQALFRKRYAWPLYFLSGLLVGFAMMIRPIAIGVVAPMSIILWLVRRDRTAPCRLFLVSMLLLGNLVAIFPWETWVYSATGRVVMLSTNGPRSIRDGLLFDVAGASKNQRQMVKLPEDVAALTQGMLVHFDEAPSLGRFVSVLVEKLQTQPLTVIKLFTLKAVRSWYGTHSGRFETPIMLIQIVYLALILSGSIMAWRQGGIAKQLTVSIWLMAFYFWGMTTLVLSILRYMVPMMGLLFVVVPGVFCNWSSCVRIGNGGSNT